MLYVKTIFPMELGFLLLLLPVSAGAAWLLTRRALPDPGVRALAEALGLGIQSAPAGGADRTWVLRGRWRGMDATLRFEPRAMSSVELSTLVELRPVHAGLGLRAAAVGPPPAAADRAVHTGDPAFDYEVVAWGDETLARALLDAPTRAAARAVMRYGLAEVAGGRVLLGEDAPRLSPESARELLDEAADLAERLGPDAFDEERLFAVAVEDPCPGVRARALVCLWRTGEPDAVELAADAARADPQPAVRAIGVLMSEDLDRIAALSPDALREAAAAAPSTVAHALGVLGQEDAVFDLLESPEPAVVLAAVHALGAMGSIRAVEALAPLAQRRAQDPGLREAAREALARLEDRLGTPEPSRSEDMMLD